ncbi:hypothetical protein OAS39_13315, partial [Pirellulales bacterium]|nr:hypothetical protein [Pirellulales bacterium]
MNNRRPISFFLSGLIAAILAAPASAQPVLQWNFDEAASGSQDALDSGVAPPNTGIFNGGATRTSTTPGGASTGAADLFVGAVGTDAYIEADDISGTDNLSAITITTWLNLQADPAGNDRLIALQAGANPPNADFDNSGTVDAPDGVILQQGYGITDGTALNAEGDATSDGNVNGDDVLVYQRQFGGGVGPFGDFAGFSLNLNSPGDGTYAADDFRLGMFIGGIDNFGDPFFDFGQSVDIEGLGTDSWIFIAVTFDGDTGDLFFYTGSESGAPTQLGEGFVLEPFSIESTNGGTLYVGKTEAAPNANTSLEGFVDDVRVYNTALTAAELETIRLENL